MRSADPRTVNDGLIGQTPARIQLHFGDNDSRDPQDIILALARALARIAAREDDAMEHCEADYGSDRDTR
ncbi:MAG: hypothetical protein ACKVP7_09765 [Hyphomicrobiaceae bacterium]